MPAPTDRPIMTDVQYVRARGAQCPYCRGTSITGDEINHNAGSLDQEITCDDCGAEWYDIYRLVTFETRTPPQRSPDGDDAPPAQNPSSNEDPNEA